MRQLNEARNVRGEGVLIEEMRLYDEESHFRYFRMTRRRFDALLSLIGPMIARKNNHRYPIAEKTRLAVTLRLLATGDSQVTVATSFRIGASTVNGIFKETCSAVWTALKDDYLHFPESQR